MAAGLNLVHDHLTKNVNGCYDLPLPRRCRVHHLSLTLASSAESVNLALVVLIRSFGNTIVNRISAAWARFERILQIQHRRGVTMLNPEYPLESRPSR